MLLSLVLIVVLLRVIVVIPEKSALIDYTVYIIYIPFVAIADIAINTFLQRRRKIEIHIDCSISSAIGNSTLRHFFFFLSLFVLSCVFYLHFLFHFFFFFYVLGPILLPFLLTFSLVFFFSPLFLVFSSLSLSVLFILFSLSFSLSFQQSRFVQSCFS